MKHIEVQTLKEELDILMTAIAEQKITNSYLNYGLIKNLKILTKANSLITEAISKDLIEMEKEFFEVGKKKFQELPKETQDALNQSSNSRILNNYIFNLAYETASKKDIEKYTKLKEEYITFLNLEDDVILYTLDFSKLNEVDLELKYWAILEKFIE